MPKVPSDIEIAQAAKMEPIEAIAEKMGLTRQDIELYGDYMAKIKLEAIEKFKDKPDAKYVVVTAITPTPLGEGKSTTTVGLCQAFHHVGKSAVVAMRQPSHSEFFRALKAAQQVAATARSSRWRISTCT